MLFLVVIHSVADSANRRVEVVICEIVLCGGLVSSCCSLVVMKSVVNSGAGQP
jgi:hypothetical protein